MTHAENRPCRAASRGQNRQTAPPTMLSIWLMVFVIHLIYNSKTRCRQKRHRGGIPTASRLSAPPWAAQTPDRGRYIVWFRLAPGRVISAMPPSPCLIPTVPAPMPLNVTDPSPIFTVMLSSPNSTV